MRACAHACGVGLACGDAGADAALEGGAQAVQPTERAAERCHRSARALAVCRCRLAEFVDFVVCLGGDGVILHASHLFQHHIPPVRAGGSAREPPPQGRTHAAHTVPGRQGRKEVTPQRGGCTGSP